jgi:hypothetical protein
MKRQSINEEKTKENKHTDVKLRNGKGRERERRYKKERRENYHTARERTNSM